MSYNTTKTPEEIERCLKILQEKRAQYWREHPEIPRKLFHSKQVESEERRKEAREKKVLDHLAELQRKKDLRIKAKNERANRKAELVRWKPWVCDECGVTCTLGHRYGHAKKFHTGERGKTDYTDIKIKNQTEYVCPTCGDTVEFGARFHHNIRLHRLGT